MARLNRLRNHGAIPERQHDAFLAALLIALTLNIIVFAVQAVMPRIVSLLRLLAPEQAETLREEESYPFVLVDPSFLDEQLDAERPPEAQAMLNREARQTEARPDLPEDSATVTEGVDEILTAMTGNPGPAMSSSASSPGDAMEQPGDEAMESPSEPEPQEPTEARETEPPEIPEETPREQPMPEPADTPPAEPPPSEPEPIAEQLDPVPEPMPEPPEDLPEPEPEDMPPPPEDADEPPPEEQPDPMADIIDLAALPQSADGFFDPRIRRREEEALERRQAEPQAIQPRQFEEAPQPVAPQPREPSQTRPRRTPTFRRLGEPGSRSAAGGAPPRRNASTSVRLLDADASMRLLAHRYGPYMQKLAEQLQASLLRQMVLTPAGYTGGQIKIRFGISPDGSLAYYETIFPEDNSKTVERLISERTVWEAAPFEPLTPEMARDENFQRMTVIVNLY